MSFLLPILAGAGETAAVGAGEAAGAAAAGAGATAAETTLAEAGSAGNMGRVANLTQGIKDGKVNATPSNQTDKKSEDVTDISSITDGGRMY